MRGIRKELSDDTVRSVVHLLFFFSKKLICSLPGKSWKSTGAPPACSKQDCRRMLFKKIPHDTYAHIKEIPPGAVWRWAVRENAHTEITEHPSSTGGSMAKAINKEVVKVGGGGHAFPFFETVKWRDVIISSMTDRVFIGMLMQG